MSSLGLTLMKGDEAVETLEEGANPTLLFHSAGQKNSLFEQI